MSLTVEIEDTFQLATRAGTKSPMSRSLKRCHIYFRILDSARGVDVMRREVCPRGTDEMMMNESRKVLHSVSKMAATLD